jgi:transposase
MATREFQLTEAQIRELWLTYDQTADPELQKRVQAVRMYGQGSAVKDIGRAVGCGERTLRRWCAKYRSGGMTALRPQWRGGNNAKLTAEQRAEVTEKLHRYRPDQILPPDVRLSQGAFWTVSDLRIALRRWYQVSWQSDNSYRSLLQEAGFSLQRSESQYRSRADAQRIADFEAELEKK